MSKVYLFTISDKIHSFRSFSNQITQRKAPKKKVYSPFNSRPPLAGKAIRRKPLEASLEHKPYRPHSAHVEYPKSGKKNGYVNGKSDLERPVL